MYRLNDLLPSEDDGDREIEEIDSEFETVNDGSEETAGIQQSEYLADLLMQ